MQSRLGFCSLGKQAQRDRLARPPRVNLPRATEGHPKHRQRTGDQVGGRHGKFCPVGKTAAALSLCGVQRRSGHHGKRKQGAGQDSGGRFISIAANWLGWRLRDSTFLGGRPRFRNFLVRPSQADGGRALSRCQKTKSADISVRAFLIRSVTYGNTRTR